MFSVGASDLKASREDENDSASCVEHSEGCKRVVFLYKMRELDRINVRGSVRVGDLKEDLAKKHGLTSEQFSLHNLSSGELIDSHLVFSKGVSSCAVFILPRHAESAEHLASRVPSNATRFIALQLWLWEATVPWYVAVPESMQVWELCEAIACRYNCFRSDVGVFIKGSRKVLQDEWLLRKLQRVLDVRFRSNQRRVQR